MKKFLMVALMMVGISASAQQITQNNTTINYNGGLFTHGYYVGGMYASPYAFASQLRTNPEAYALWKQGSANIVAGSVVLYPSAFIFGWGIGGLGWDDSAGVYIGAGALGMGIGYYLMDIGLDLRNAAILKYNQGQNKVGLKPLMNNNGAGIALTF